MGFKFGKLLGFLAFPSTMVFALLVIGCLGLLLAGARPRLRRAAVALVVTATVVYGLLGGTNLWLALARPLEERFPDLAADAPPPAGIVFIGGVVDGSTEPLAGRPKLGMGAEAIDETLRLARRYPDVPIVLSGTGSFSVEGADLSEAATMARLLIAAGIPSDRLILERRSRTTWENARLSYEMVWPAPGARWLLVTPAWHMPRSIGAFRAAGWTGIVAAPSLGERLRPPSLNASPADALRLFDVMSREWLGLVAYRLLGRSTALFPAP
jgi:uncharacterized SAM-binding protein YcdF (DUF218 family)